MSFEFRRGKRGFASMSDERKKKIASMGGKAAHKAGTAHEWDAKSASAAGKLGGKASRGGRGKLPVSNS